MKAEKVSPYEPIGFRKFCPMCGKEIDTRKSPYEAIGYKQFCKCNRS